MWKSIIHFKISVIMENNAFLSSFAAEFAALPLSSLVESFNSQVGNRGWSSARAAHNRALIDELIRRGIDVSTVFDGSRTTFAHYVELDATSSKLVVLD